eukprot:732684-Rhodomonas_salina.1
MMICGRNFKCGSEASAIRIGGPPLFAVVPSLLPAVLERAPTSLPRTACRSVADAPMKLVSPPGACRPVIRASTMMNEGVSAHLELVLPVLLDDSGEVVAERIQELDGRVVQQQRIALQALPHLLLATRIQHRRVVDDSQTQHLRDDFGTLREACVL